MVRSKTLAFSVPRLVLSIALMLLSVGFKPSSVSAAFKEFPSEEISSVRTSVVGSPLGRKVAIPDGLAFSARQDIVADSLVYRATEWKGIFAALKIPERITESYAEFQDLLTYKVNQLLTANVFSKLIMFFSFSAALVFFGAWLCLVTGETNWRSALFKSYALLNNAPGVSVVDEEKPQSAFIANILFVTGCLTFAVLLGTITSAIEVALSSALSGTHKIVERDHIVMLNWNDKTIPMLRQIEAAASDGRIPLKPVVILASKEKEEMDQELADQLEKTTLPIFTRKGNPGTLPDLRMVSAGAAQHVLILPDETKDEADLISQAACLQALQADRQPGKKIGPNKNDIKVVVADCDPEGERDLDELMFVTKNSFSRRIMAVTALEPRLASVYTDILDQSKGSEIYLRSSEMYPWLQGKSFKQMGAHFPDSVLLGWITSDGKVMMNPSGNEILPEKSKLVILSKNDKITCWRRAAQTKDAAWSPAVRDVEQALRADPKHVLVLNLDRDGEILSEIDNILPRGSSVTAVHPDPIIFWPNHAKFKHIQGSSLSKSDVKKIPLHDIETIIIPADGKSESLTAGERDARVLAATKIVLEARKSQGHTKPLQIIAEIQNSLTCSLAEKFALSNPGVHIQCVQTSYLEAGAFVQVLWNPEVNSVYQDFLDATGSEIVAVDASFFGPSGSIRTFGQISELAMSKKAVALGILRKDGNVDMSPHRSASFRLEEGLKVVLFADGV
uniref:CASTOR/POLLUX/SYM8 ion channel conserved domain-containing protein n=1 Tax=Guillardia theta TaxID=55529 RepID=A0A7S4JJQ3_GUITH